ncbi:MAG TPA: amidohydrolase family protein [Acidimicrobiales bacterium]|nr:amidohydrolase family protein [Acidimicrobiales bacterium]
MPLPDDVQIISVDDHVVEHRNVWQDRLPEKYKEAGPRSVRDDEGRDVWMFEGQPHYNIGLNAVAGKPRTEFGLDPVAYDHMLPGCYDPKARVQDMDVDGIWAQLPFPSFPGFCGSTFHQAEDKDLATACVSAYNDWMIDEWCGYAPERQIPLVLVPFWDVEASVKEIERVAAKGAKAISFTESPHGIGLPSFHTDHWDPLLAAAQDADLPLCLHFGSGGAPTVAPEAPFLVAIALFGLNSQMTTVDLLLSPVFHKFPRLRVALSEGGIGWMPYILERTDYSWDRHRWYQDVDRENKPSDLFREHIFGCFIYDEAGLHSLDLIGEDNVMFEGDYPHSDSNWPNSRKMLAEVMLDFPGGTARKVAEMNARRVFNFPRSQ